MHMLRPASHWSSKLPLGRTQRSTVAHAVDNPISFQRRNPYQSLKVSLVVSKGEDETQSNANLKFYTVQHEKVYKNSSLLSTTVITPVECGIALQNGEKFIIGDMTVVCFRSLSAYLYGITTGNSYAGERLYLKKCDLRKKWEKVSPVVKAKLEEFYKSPDDFCYKNRKIDVPLDDF
ncbi:hypothetical protein ANCCAN_26384 [Ancylostoma caninum]|uniref:NTR domain-containing protein n=1 Tax=Ancylostoma caninum TaxID=29170 RepID=A0A368FA52_ANCCA|nr:hypothetical protein ANCCAN_26384 [Ancylostoma caninum]